MTAAFAWGLVAASSLVLGALLALHRPIGRRALGLVMAFGAGVLISAVAYELVEEAFATAAGDGVALGLLTGSLVFFVGDGMIDRLDSGGGPGLAIVLGTVLDGVPESVVLGLTVLEEGSVSVALLIAVVLSNLPEAVAATSGLIDGGWPPRRILALWGAVAVISATAASAGYALFGSASPATLAFVLAFAAGAILCMLADTMMPDAFAHGGKAAGLVTTFGFALAFAISAAE
jgi:ZIP family zinc transporter